MLQYLESFIYPILIEHRKGEVNPYLEVVKYNGKYQLNNERANLSFGGLHKVFEQFFKEIQLEKYSFKKVLLLGMGAGSIVSLLNNKYRNALHITAVEKDTVVVELAAKYFKINQYTNLTIVQEDAFDFACRADEKYDLIISDLFIDIEVPTIFSSHEYLNHLQQISANRGMVIFNKITDLPAQKLELISLFNDFDDCFPGSQVKQINSNGMENSLLYFNSLGLVN